MGELFAVVSLWRKCRARLLLVARPVEVRTVEENWLNDPKHNENSQTMARKTCRQRQSPLSPKYHLSN
jgi:hypothetical protein